MKRYQRVLILTGICCMGILSMAAAKYHRVKAESLQPEIAQKILRFHIRANSDEEVDQELKLKVRDAVGALMGEALQGSGTLEESREITEKKLPEIISCAQDLIWEEGYTYGVEAYLTTTYFPEKTYDAYTFPEGEYEALEVNIGKGEGHNWWCVLYPNMCFRGSVYEVAQDEAKEELQEVLTPEEYSAVFSEGNYEIRFFLLDWLGEAVESFSGQN